MYSFRRGLRLVGRALFIVLVLLTAGLAPVAALPFMYIAERRRAKEVAALIVRNRSQ